MFWDGTRWVPEEPAPRAESPPSSRFATWTATIVMIVGFAALLAPMQLLAASHRKSDPPCVISPSPVTVGETYVVSASGLPTNTAINLWVTQHGVTVGTPLGSTPDGTFNLWESSSMAGVTSYEFTGPVKHHTVVYSTCSVNAS